MFRWFVDEAVLHNWALASPTWMLLVALVLSIAVLSKGSEWLIDGVVALAQRTGLPKVVIGATIVSLGTTMPEAFVSVMAAFMGNPGLALGNGVGSIIADTGLIFGLTCLLTTVPMQRYILNRTGWVQVGAATLLVAIALVLLGLSDGDPVLGRPFGIFFLILLVVYLYATYHWAKNGGDAVAPDTHSDPQENPMGMTQSGVMIGGGLLAVIIGAKVLIPCASVLAGRWGVPEDVIAATMVAFGTSVPELVTAVTAVRKGHPEITVGNIVGADVLNCLFVIGAAATARPLAIPPTFFYFHFPAMMLILWSFRSFISMNRDGTFKRWQGIWLLTIYAVYIALQFGLKLG